MPYKEIKSVHVVDDPAYIHTFGLNTDVVNQTAARILGRLYPGGLPHNEEVGMLNVLRATLYELHANGWEGNPEEMAQIIMERSRHIV